MYILSFLCICISAKGKKGGAADDDEKDSTPGDLVIPTLPDVKMCAAKAIARCARSSKLQSHLVIDLLHSVKVVV
jgi:hypothetical protein